MEDAVALRGGRAPIRPPESLYEDVYVRSPYINMKAAEKDPAWRASVREDRVPRRASARPRRAGHGRRRPPRRRKRRSAEGRASHGRHHHARGAEPGHEGGDGARPQRLHPGRGGRRPTRARYKITQGLLAQFGEWRVRDTPIAEEAIAGVAVGAAFTGLRPIAEMMTFNFSLPGPGP